MMRRILFMFLLLFITSASHAQFLMDMVDTATEKGKNMLNNNKKNDHLQFTGYIQPQFQIAASEGAKTYEGGDFAAKSSNRFMLRRSRIRLDYIHFDQANKAGVQFVFQFDANERAFTVRDVWGRIFENKWKLFSFTTGLFARPFGYEVNLSSSDRESPERGRMSQILMKGERDLGAMVTFDVRKERHLLKALKIDIGIFNGQGLNAPGEFDNHKDLIARISLKPKKVSKKITIALGTSLLYGGLVNNTKYVYATQNIAGIKKYVVDSADGNIYKIAPRKYFGADVQLKIKNKIGFTELRAEFIAGVQTGTSATSETPAVLLTGKDGFYTRHFSGAYFYLIQNIFTTKQQLVLKYDIYDPNTQVNKNDIGATGSNLNAADIKYQSINVGYVNYLITNVKAMLFYSIPLNKKTMLAGYDSHLKNNVTTVRLQFRF